MTQVAGMNSAPASRIPMPKARPPNVYQNGYDQQHKTLPAPSKLEQMQMQYQQKLHQNKEKRMGEIHQQSDQRAKTFGGENGTNGSLVKDFFRERREMAEQGYAPNIDQHYLRKKAEISGSTYATQYQHKKQFGYNGRPPAHKNSAGRDKANPLAPIDHGTKGQKSRKSSAASNGSYPSTTYQKKLPPGVRSLPPSRKTSFAGSGRATPTGYQSNGEGNGDFYSDRSGRQQQGDNYDEENQAAILSSRNVGQHNKKISFKEWQHKQKKTRNGPTSNDSQNRMSEAEEHPEKLTDFQKWQIEQDTQKADRLQKHSKANGIANGYQHSPPGSHRQSPTKRSSPPSKNGGNSPGMVRHQKQVLLQKHINTQSKKHLYASHSSNISYQDSEDEDSEENGGLDENMVKKQKELEAMIKQQQDELKKMRVQRAAEEEEARKAREREAKRIAQQERRQRKLQEAEERDRQEREEQEQKEREKRELDEKDREWLQEQKRTQSQANSKQAPSYDQDRYRTKSNRYDAEDTYNDSYGGVPSSRAESPPEHTKPFIPKKAARVRSNNKAKLTQAPPRREPTPEQEYYPPQQPASYNLDAEDDEAYRKVDVAPCKVCGRKFARDRLTKHMSACKRTQKPRKVFDVSKMRTDGTDLAKYTDPRQRKPEPPQKKNNWKKQHENFIATIRYAKQVTDAENAGTSLANLPPPPVTEDPDLVPCPHCKRTFNQTAAERHIPRCKDVKTRPAAFRTHKK